MSYDVEVIKTIVTRLEVTAETPEQAAERALALISDQWKEGAPLRCVVYDGRGDIAHEQ